MSDWDKFEDDTASSGMQKLIEEYTETKTIFDEAKEKVTTIEAKIVAEFTDEFGEQSKQIGSNIVTINRQERFDWDQDKLEALFHSGTVPEYVRKRLSVDKRSFQRLTETEQTPLLVALTRKPGPVSVKVTRSS
tara:strand:+ start:26 stop:427 length:402 start_codon:yes stop_codon:yes gene_type:complete